MSDNTEKNRSHWNIESTSYNSKHGKTIQQIISEIQKRRAWIGVDWVSDASDIEDEPSSSEPRRAVRLLDYACGTGLVSRALASSVTQCVGIDLTAGMVHEYNNAAQNQGIPESEMHAVVGNLIDALNPNPPELADDIYFGFDIAVVGLGFHHFDEPGLAAKRLAERVKKGGILMIIDFLPHEHFHGHGHSHAYFENQADAEAAAKTVVHMGFSEASIRRIFEDAGVGERFEYVKIGKGMVFGQGERKMDREVFFARGFKL